MFSNILNNPVCPIWVNWIAVVFLVVFLVVGGLILYISDVQISDFKIYRYLSGGVWRYIPRHNAGPQGNNLPFSTWVKGEWVQISPPEKEEKEVEDENYN